MAEDIAESTFVEELIPWMGHITRMWGLNMPGTYLKVNLPQLISKLDDDTATTLDEWASDNYILPIDNNGKENEEEKLTNLCRFVKKNIVGKNPVATFQSLRFFYGFLVSTKFNKKRLLQICKNLGLPCSARDLAKKSTLGIEKSQLAVHNLKIIMLTDVLGEAANGISVRAFVEKYVAVNAIPEITSEMKAVLRGLDWTVADDQLSSVETVQSYYRRSSQIVGEDDPSETQEGDGDDDDPSETQASDDDDDDPSEIQERGADGDYSDDADKGTEDEEVGSVVWTEQCHPNNRLLHCAATQEGVANEQIALPLLMEMIQDMLSVAHDKEFARPMNQLRQSALKHLWAGEQLLSPVDQNPERVLFSKVGVEKKRCRKPLKKETSGKDEAGADPLPSVDEALLLDSAFFVQDAFARAALVRSHGYENSVSDEKLLASFDDAISNISQYHTDSAKKKRRIQDFNVERVIGSGAYGCVIKAHPKDSPDVKLAIKVDIAPDGHTASHIRSLREWSVLYHPFIAQLFDVIVLPLRGEFLATASFMVLGTHSLLKEVTDPLSRPHMDIRDYLVEFLYVSSIALAYCHAENILHRDVKLENFIRLMNGHILLVDFGLAREICKKRVMTGHRGTEGYMAPELRNKDQEAVYGPTADVYSLVCCLYEIVMLDGDTKPPDDMLGQCSDFMKAFRQGSSSMEVNETVRELFEGMAAVDPNQRFSALKVWQKTRDLIKSDPVRFEKLLSLPFMEADVPWTHLQCDKLREGNCRACFAEEHDYNNCPVLEEMRKNKNDGRVVDKFVSEVASRTHPKWATITLQEYLKQDMAKIASVQGKMKAHWDNA